MNKNREEKNYYFKPMFFSILLTVFLFSSFSFQYSSGAPSIPSSQPFVSPLTPLSVNTTNSLNIKQVQITKSAIPIWFFHVIPLSELVINASIQTRILSLPDEKTGRGLVNYVVTFPNGTTHDYGAFNASWYEFYFSPFIYPDWEGWKKYFYAWKSGNVNEQSYAPYHDFNYTIYETNDYFGIITNEKPDYNNNEVYFSSREFVQKLWFDKNTGALVYEYWYSNYTVIYRDTTKTPYIYAFLIEAYNPNIDFSQINTEKNSTSETNHVFNLPFPSTTYIFIIITIIAVNRKNMKKLLN